MQFVPACIHSLQHISFNESRGRSLPRGQWTVLGRRRGSSSNSQISNQTAKNLPARMVVLFCATELLALATGSWELGYRSILHCVPRKSENAHRTSNNKFRNKKAVVKANSQSNGNGQISIPRGFKTPERISMKLGIYNYVGCMITHANPHCAATTWVVPANTSRRTRDMSHISVFLVYLFMVALWNRADH